MSLKNVSENCNKPPVEFFARSLVSSVAEVITGLFWSATAALPVAGISGEATLSGIGVAAGAAASWGAYVPVIGSAVGAVGVLISGMIDGGTLVQLWKQRDATAEENQKGAIEKKMKLVAVALVIDLLAMTVVGACIALDLATVWKGVPIFTLVAAAAVAGLTVARFAVLFKANQLAIPTEPSFKEVEKIGMNNNKKHACSGIELESQSVDQLLWNIAKEGRQDQEKTGAIWEAFSVAIEAIDIDFKFIVIDIGAGQKKRFQELLEMKGSPVSEGSPRDVKEMFAEYRAENDREENGFDGYRKDWLIALVCAIEEKAKQEKENDQLLDNCKKAIELFSLYAMCSDVQNKGPAQHSVGVRLSTLQWIWSDSRLMDESNTPLLSAIAQPLAYRMYQEMREALPSTPPSSLSGAPTTSSTLPSSSGGLPDENSFVTSSSATGIKRFAWDRPAKQKILSMGFAVVQLAKTLSKENAIAADLAKAATALLEQINVGKEIDDVLSGELNRPVGGQYPLDGLIQEHSNDQELIVKFESLVGIYGEESEIYQKALLFINALCDRLLSEMKDGNQSEGIFCANAFFNSVNMLCEKGKELRTTLEKANREAALPLIAAVELQVGTVNQDRDVIELDRQAGRVSALYGFLLFGRKVVVVQNGKIAATCQLPLHATITKVGDQNVSNKREIIIGVLNAKSEISICTSAGKEIKLPKVIEDTDSAVANEVWEKFGIRFMETVDKNGSHSITVSEIKVGSVAAESPFGFEVGDRITEVNRRKCSTAQEVYVEILAHRARSLEKYSSLTFSGTNSDGSPFEETGITPRQVFLRRLGIHW